MKVCSSWIKQKDRWIYQRFFLTRDNTPNKNQHMINILYYNSDWFFTYSLSNDLSKLFNFKNEINKDKEFYIKKIDYILLKEGYKFVDLEAFNKYKVLI